MPPNGNTCGNSGAWRILVHIKDYTIMCDPFLFEHSSKFRRSLLNCLYNFILYIFLAYRVSSILKLSQTSGVDLVTRATLINT